MTFKVKKMMWKEDDESRRAYVEYDLSDNGEITILDHIGDKPKYFFPETFVKEKIEAYELAVPRPDIFPGYKQVQNYDPNSPPGFKENDNG